jgi:hypothetical protein
MTLMERVAPVVDTPFEDNQQITVFGKIVQTADYDELNRLVAAGPKGHGGRKGHLVRLFQGGECCRSRSFF